MPLAGRGAGSESFSEASGQQKGPTYGHTESASPPRANMPAFSPEALLALNQHMRRRHPGEEAGEMRRKRPVRPRVKLNRDAVWAFLDQLGISQNELARRRGISPGHLSPLMNSAIQFHCSKAVVQGSPAAGTCEESQPMNNSAIITDSPNTVRLLSRTTRRLPNLKDRALGMILGLAAGNLLGLPVEGWSRSEIAAQYPQGVTEVDPRERTLPMDDDLAQAAELAEALLHPGDHVQGFAERLVRWRKENGRGIGATTAAVIRLLEQGHEPPEAARRVYEQRNHIAPNGGIMRTAPVALARLNSPQLLVADSAQTCVVTHYAPACQWSCILLNSAIALLLQGSDPSPADLAAAAAFDGAPPELGQRLRAVSQHPEALNLDQGLIGHTLLCLQAGMWALRTPLTFESALIRLVHFSAATMVHYSAADGQLSIGGGGQIVAIPRPGRGMSAYPTPYASDIKLMPSIRLKWRWLLVNRMSPLQMAVAPIRRSRSGIAFPAPLSLRRSRANIRQAGSVSGRTVSPAERSSNTFRWPSSTCRPS